MTRKLTYGSWSGKKHRPPRYFVGAEKWPDEKILALAEDWWIRFANQPGVISDNGKRIMRLLIDRLQVRVLE